MTDATPGPWPTDAAASGAGAPARTVTLIDLLRVPVHRIRLVTGVALVGLLAALTYVLAVPSAVTANAVVAVRPVVTDAFSPSGGNADRAVNMNVESGIATGTDVVQRLVDKTGQDQRAVRDALEVEVPTGGQILRFLYTADSPDAAVEGVNLAAQAYLDVRRGMYEQQRGEMLRKYDESIAKVAAQQAALQRRIANAGDNAADAAVAELSGINNQLTQLSAARTEIAAVDVNPGWVTRQAARSLVSSGGGSMLYLLAGLLGGALLGVVLAYIWESVDRRIRSVDDGRDATGLPLLGTVRSKGFRGSRLAVDADIRYVAMAIAERVREPARVALLTTREDQTALTAGLAVALAATGRDVYAADDSGRVDRLRGIVLTDRGRLPAVANPARPVVPKPREGGKPPIDDITEQITVRRPSPHPTTTAARPSTDPDATMTLPRVAGGAPASGKSAVQDSGDEVSVGAGSVRFGTWRLRASKGLVLFNAPPAEADERGVAAARQGTAVVVVEQDRTRQGDLRRLTERLRAAGVTPLGFVLTRTGRG
ncbi:lipopolysaccharide biosynthesis protein [Micromonospora endolithica]|uniref:Lipopolysaccharide biosynthesis protein n=1 Tax=Micromonospora endolithica TaxID=230091 RepID=A0A3A9YW09_9ACTN|nr:lipopolysaccharide biosynthesis protein [Micromonospora endolithica]RKN40262.1 lipopolysaccharide biosynthesis protein [Micromonospora endolithica]TWJ22581.1 capsular polysaccharide biosynthesis protein [Micromonospora endolithica]